MEKIHEVINNRIQEKKKNEFTDLAPIDDIENGAEYLKALHWAIKKKKVNVVSGFDNRQKENFDFSSSLLIYISEILLEV